MFWRGRYLQIGTLSAIFYFIVGLLYLSISIALLTAGAFQKRSRPQQLTLYRSLHAEALHPTASEGFAHGRVVTWRLEQDSNPRHSGRKASTLPMRHN